MGFMPILLKQAERDAYAKARGEPTRVFHDVQPNWGHPEIAKIFAEAAAQKKAQAVKAPQPRVAKVEPKTVEPEPAPQMEGRVPTVKRKTQSRGRTIMNPLAGKNEGSTYKKKLLGD